MDVEDKARVCLTFSPYKAFLLALEGREVFTVGDFIVKLGIFGARVTRISPFFILKRNKWAAFELEGYLILKCALRDVILRDLPLTALVDRVTISKKIEILKVYAQEIANDRIKLMPINLLSGVDKWLNFFANDEIVYSKDGGTTAFSSEVANEMEFWEKLAKLTGKSFRLD